MAVNIHQRQIMPEQTTIGQDLASLWTSLAKESNGPEVTPVTTETQPVQTTGVAAPAQETPVTPKVETTPTATPVTQATAAPTPAVAPVTNGIVEDWDTVAPAPVVAPVTVAPVQVQPQFDFSDVAKALGQEIKSKEDLIQSVTATKAKVDALSSLPENLAKAIEISQLGGNYLEYLGVTQVDWSKEDPITLYENSVINDLTDTNGAVDYERVDRILDKIDDDEKELRGRNLQRQYSTYQSNQKAQLENQARAQRQAFEQSVKRSVEGLNEIFGFKLSPAHKDELYSDIVKGEDLKQADVNQRIINRFITKNFGKIDSFRKTQIQNAVKREMLQEAQLPALTPSTETLTSAPAKAYGLEDYIKELGNKGTRRTF